MTENTNAQYEHLPFRKSTDIRFEKYELVYTSEQHHSRHFHETSEIMLFKNYSGNIWINGRTHSFKPPFLIYFPQYFVHEFNILKGRYDCFLINFTDDYLRSLDFTGNMQDRPLTLELNDSDAKRLWNVMDWYHETASDTSPFKKDLFRLIVSYVNNNYSSDRIAFKGSQQTYNRFSGLFRYMEKESLYNIDVNKAASVCGLSRSHFLNLFKDFFKLTFHKFLLTRRINTAMHYLAETTMNITQISKKLGFLSSAHFSKAFKLIRDESPRDFRKSIEGRSYVHKGN